MLTTLTIRHFAIIDHAEIDLNSGFSVITGETGAGKSILVDALGLLMGQRADANVVARDQKQADLTAHFNVAHHDLAQQWLQAQAMSEDDGTVLIRRTIQAAGGSKAWINGHPASASQLKDIGSLLVEIHGQHAHQQLSRVEQQRRLLDRQCDGQMLVAVERQYKCWQEAQLALEQFEADVGDPSQLALLEFQVSELEELGLASGEFEALEREHDKRQRQDEIQTAIYSAQTALDHDDSPNARSLILQALNAIEPLASLDPRLTNITALLNESTINLSEALADLDDVQSDFDESEPDQLTHISQRLSQALALARKHRVRPEELPALTDSLVDRLANLQGQDERRSTLNQAIGQARSDWREAAVVLSEARQKAAQALSQSVSASLGQLGMTQAQFSFEVKTADDRPPSPHGFDDVAIYFSANPGAEPQPLSKVASGGELSRVSLALMLAVGSHQVPKTRVFDEVDSGIGGETAHIVGEFLRRVGQANENDSQSLCVTHLAQVAARADQHYRVTKHQANDTQVSIQWLSDEERTQEIARMLGDSQSKTSLAHARELMAAHQ